MTATSRSGQSVGFRLVTLVVIVLLIAAIIALAIWRPDFRDLPGSAALGASNDEPFVAVANGDPTAGRAAIEYYGCITCHTIPGVPGAEGHVGPPLTDWADRVYIAGLLTNTPEHLVSFLVNPQAVLPGGAMPVMGVTEDEARDIAAYLYTLRGRR